jgi:hypothetical protein
LRRRRDHNAFSFTNALGLTIPNVVNDRLLSHAPSKPQPPIPSKRGETKQTSAEALVCRDGLGMKFAGDSAADQSQGRPRGLAPEIRCSFTPEAGKAGAAGPVGRAVYGFGNSVIALDCFPGHRRSACPAAPTSRYLVLLGIRPVGRQVRRYRAGWPAARPAIPFLFSGARL